MLQQLLAQRVALAHRALQRRVRLALLPPAIAGPGVVVWVPHNVTTSQHAAPRSKPGLPARMLTFANSPHLKLQYRTPPNRYTIVHCEPRQAHRVAAISRSVSASSSCRLSSRAEDAEDTDMRLLGLRAAFEGSVRAVSAHGLVGALQG